MERNRPKSPVSFFQVTSEPPKPLPRPFSTTDGISALTGSSQGSSTIKASRSNIFHGIRFTKSKSSEEREKKRSKEPPEANQSITPTSSRNFVTGYLDSALNKGKGKSKDSHPSLESQIPESLTPAEEYRRLHQANHTQRAPNAHEPDQGIDLATASSRALQALMSPNHMPALARSPRPHSSVRDTDGRDFLNELEAAAEDDIPSWLATESDVKTSEELSNAS